MANDRDGDVRLAAYRGFVETGRAPTAGELAGRLGMEVGDVRGALSRLHAARHVVLDQRGEIVMAHPFAAVPLGFSVMGSRTLWWGGCAWDSFAIPHLVQDDPEVLIATRCPGCGAALAWVVGREEPPDGEQVAHFLTPMAKVWDDVLRACGNQRLFCSVGCVDRWLEATGSQRGYVMDLGTLWRLAAGWYEGRLDAGYVRRDPAQARDYFGAVGLGGAFWGLD